MAQDSSSLPKFLVPETGTSNFAHVLCILVADFSGTRNLGGVGQWVTSLFDLTFAEPVCWAKIRSKYLLKPKSEVISQSDISTYLDWSLLELWSN